jgi:geranylgeranyl pyrophosphate synthase
MVEKNIIYDAQTGKTTVVDYTAEEQAAYDDYNSTAKVNARKLEQIKAIRLEKLKATDYMANSDYTMPDYIKTWRQSLRDIPANNDSSKYDDLLKRDDNGNLTHAIWTQPKE